MPALVVSAIIFCEGPMILTSCHVDYLTAYYDKYSVTVGAPGLRCEGRTAETTGRASVGKASRGRRRGGS